MFRRHFVTGMTFASGGSILAAKLAEAGRPTAAIYRVTGFTCITCAVGLETLLKAKRGVVHVKASYPEGIVRVDYDQDFVTDASLRDYISEMGFKVADQH